MRVAYFTAGTVGAGHLVRGEAIRRGLARAGSRARVRSFGPATRFDAWIRGDHVSVEVRGDPALADPARDQRLRVERFRGHLMSENGADTLARWIEESSQRWAINDRANPVCFDGGNSPLSTRP